MTTNDAFKYARIERNGNECTIYIKTDDGWIPHGTYEFMGEEFAKDLEKLAYDGYTVEWEGKEI